MDYLVKSDIDPEDFVNFLYKMWHADGAEESSMEWMSTHPESKDRAEYVIEYSKGKSQKKRSRLTRNLE